MSQSRHYEMSDVTVLSKYSDIISGSMTRGKIKGSNIENGTRYVKNLNCVPVLSLKDELGRFTLRLFAEDNRTPCRYCGETSHPYFKCTEQTLSMERKGRVHAKNTTCTADSHPNSIKPRQENNMNVNGHKTQKTHRNKTSIY